MGSRPHTHLQLVAASPSPFRTTFSLHSHNPPPPHGKLHFPACHSIAQTNIDSTFLLSGGGGGGGGRGLGGHVLREQDNTLLGNKETGCQPLLGHRGESARAGADSWPLHRNDISPYRPQFHRHGVLRSRQLRRTFAERARPRVDARGIAKRSGRRKNLFPELVLRRPREKPFAGAFPWQQSAVRARAAQSE